MRIQLLQHTLKEKNIDLGLIISLDEVPNTSMLYFADYAGLGVLAVPAQKKPFLVVPAMDYERAKKTGLKVYKDRKLFDKVKEIAFPKTIAFEEDKCTVAMFRKLKKIMECKWKNLSPILKEQRMTKDENELKLIKRACSITDKVFDTVLEKFRQDSFKTEQEVAACIKNEIFAQGCELAFPPIVASGKASSQPHYEPSQKLKKGFLLMDFGAKYKGYCADMTRTVYYGDPGAEEIRDYKLLMKTVAACEKAAPKAKTFGSLFTLAQKELGAKKKYFIHSLGHGLGMDIHEAPPLAPKDKTLIKENIPFTIEPGIYMPGKYGIRIEDTCVIRKGMTEVLTKSSKELTIVG